MHTSRLLKSDDFSFELQGKAASFDDVFPGFTVLDRIGVVVGRPGGSIGTSILYMAAITKFYDYYRSRLGNAPDKLRIYPDYYIFHVGMKHMDHYWMDIWPPHKEVIVENRPESILQAINDRGITRLIVEDVPAVPADFLRETISSANHRVKTILAYSFSGIVERAFIKAKGPAIIEKLIKDSLKRSENLTEEMYMDYRLQALVDGGAAETFRPISLQEAVQKLAMHPVHNECLLEQE